MSHASVLVAIDPTDDIEAAVDEQMKPYDENGKWFGDGSRWDWWQIGGRFSGWLADGDVLRRGDVDLDQLRVHLANEYRKSFEEAIKGSLPDDLKDMLYGIKKGETAEQYIARKMEGNPFPAHYAFLRNHVWNEHGRMGWWATSTATECELRGHDAHICSFEKDGIKIVSWGDSDSWGSQFYKRFVEPLPPETLLVTVDYHV